MKNKLTLLLLSALSLGACRSLHFSDYHSAQTLPTKLPQLELMVHQSSFLDAYDDQYLRYRTPYNDDYWYGVQITDRSVEDVFTLLDRDLKENMVAGGGETYGRARFKLLHYNRPWGGGGWIIPSIATFFTANLVGMPISKVRVELELQMEITDANGKVLLRYVAPGKGKTPQALYYGYTGANAVRRSNLIALKDAMKNIKQKMEADLPLLTEQLLAAGTIQKIGK